MESSGEEGGGREGQERRKRETHCIQSLPSKLEYDNCQGPLHNSNGMHGNPLGAAGLSPVRARVLHSFRQRISLSSLRMKLVNMKCTLSRVGPGLRSPYGNTKILGLPALHRGCDRTYPSVSKTDMNYVLFVSRAPTKRDERNITNSSASKPLFYLLGTLASVLYRYGPHATLRRCL